MGCWLLILLTGIGSAQWRHCGAEPSTLAQETLAQETLAQETLAQEMLAGHNAVRAQVGVMPLAWSERLAKVARKWADTLLARKQFVHSPNPAYGENLYEITGGVATAAQVVQAWAGESALYDYSTNKCSGVCGHYTQIIWSATKEVGCEVVRGGGREVWVCEYDPPGNWVGRKPY